MNEQRLRQSEQLYAFVLKFYPSRYRQQFGAEMQFVFSASLRDTYAAQGERGVVVLWARTIVDIGRSLCVEHIDHQKGRTNMRDLIKGPSAFLPVVMSVAALCLVLGYVAIFGTGGQQPPGDEGLAARIFQLLLVGQMPIIAYFAIRWLPRKPKDAIQVLAVQAIAMAAAIGLILFLER